MIGKSHKSRITKFGQSYMHKRFPRIVISKNLYILCAFRKYTWVSFITSHFINWHDFIPSESNTCTGDAAVSIPATPPPKTRPSDPATETHKLLVLLCSPLFSDSFNAPDNDIISNRPCNVKWHFVKRIEPTDIDI